MALKTAELSMADYMSLNPVSVGRKVSFPEKIAAIVTARDIVDAFHSE
ncbi:MAG: hypothetical protein HY295_04790 [Thaumarchaeota archaeon]|nr:hypothetical protein [Nitrososphaerota archaeon]